MMKHEIILGGKKFPIKPLSFEKLADVMDAFGNRNRPNAGDSARDAQRIIHAALSMSNPEMTLEEVREMPVTLPEMNSALDSIARLAGLASDGKDENQGEARAVS